MVLATGGVVHHALEAAKKLDSAGLALGVANVSSLKPFDTDYIRQALSQYNRFITVEDHYIAGGLGGVVAETLAEFGQGKLHRIGVNDTFGQSGSPEALYDAYGLSAPYLQKRFAEFAK